MLGTPRLSHPAPDRVHEDGRQWRLDKRTTKKTTTRAVQVAPRVVHAGAEVSCYSSPERGSCTRRVASNARPCIPQVSGRFLFEHVASELCRGRIGSMDADRVVIDEEYRLDLSRIVNGWRESEWLRLTRKARAATAKPDSETPVDDCLVRCAWLLVHAYRGSHHVGRVKIFDHRSLQVTHYSEAATTDGDVLTRLVVLAHDAAVRVSVSASGPYNLSIMLHARERSDRNMTNHRTLEDAAAKMRERWAPLPVMIPASTVAKI